MYAYYIEFLRCASTYTKNIAKLINLKSRVGVRSNFKNCFFNYMFTFTPGLETWNGKLIRSATEA
jgi:hypothetical protein